MAERPNDCGCCAGADQLPVVRFNPPGQPAVDYRIGRHGDFKAALLARLSSSDYPALAGLRTRSDDDFTIACCDAAAAMLDVLGFYQERIANEAYLRTAAERRSIVELARLIGYRPSPGVAASAYLAFTLEDAPGLRALAARPVTIPAGTRVQSVPGPDEEPQTFETVEAVTARVEWNALPVQTSEPQTLGWGTRDIFVAGIDARVQTGDVLLIVGDERREDVTSSRWAARVVTGVEVDTRRGFTRLSWGEPLGGDDDEVVSLKYAVAERGVRAYVFRLRTALFGHNASDPKLLRLTDNLPGVTKGVAATRSWLDYDILGNQIDLDGSFPKVLRNSWFLLAGGAGTGGTKSLPGATALYRATKVRQLSRTGYGLSGKITRLTPDGTVNPATFTLRETLVLAQSEELELCGRPLDYPLYGAELPLGRRDEHLEPGQVLAIGGKRQRLRVTVDDAALAFEPEGGKPVPVKPGDSFTLTTAPALLVGGAEIARSPAELGSLFFWGIPYPLRWRVEDSDGRRGSLEALTSAVALEPAREDDPVLSELATIKEQETAIAPSGEPTVLKLRAPLANVYDRQTVVVCANLAPATHGEAVGEVAGSGDAAAAGQRFVLKQSPLTHVSADTPSGRRSTLEVRVDGLLWSEVPSLYERDPSEHVYALRQDDEQRTIVQFGDGVEGARLPSGRDNVRFGYRKFLGAAGNVGPGQLTTLLGRPLGVKAVSNPVAAGGGQDREARDAARRNAPLTVLTLDRAVSIQDYTDFARGFAGVEKAQAIWLRTGGVRGILVTVAGPDGAAIPEDSATYQNLAKALRRFGDPLVPIRILTYRPAHFRLKAKVGINAAALPDDVLPAVRDALRARFSFAERDFAQQVSLDEVMAVIQGVPGVEAVDVDELYRLEAAATPDVVPRLFALPPQILADGGLLAAELLTLEPGPVSLEVMT